MSESSPILATRPSAPIADQPANPHQQWWDDHTPDFERNAKAAAQSVDALTAVAGLVSKMAGDKAKLKVDELQKLAYPTLAKFYSANLEIHEACHEALSAANLVQLRLASVERLVAGTAGTKESTMKLLSDMHKNSSLDVKFDLERMKLIIQRYSTTFSMCAGSDLSTSVDGKATEVSKMKKTAKICTGVIAGAGAVLVTGALVCAALPLALGSTAATAAAIAGTTLGTSGVAALGASAGSYKWKCVASDAKKFARLLQRSLKEYATDGRDILTKLQDCVILGMKMRQEREMLQKSLEFALGERDVTAIDAAAMSRLKGLCVCAEEKLLALKTAIEKLSTHCLLHAAHEYSQKASLGGGHGHLAAAPETDEAAKLLTDSLLKQVNTLLPDGSKAEGVEVKLLADS